MKKTKPFLLVVFSIVFVTMGYAQHMRYDIRNGIGIQGGITLFDIVTDNFETKSSNGFIGGLTASVDIPHRWYNVSYNIQLSQNHIDINAAPFGSPTDTEYVEYKMFTAQASFLFHAKLIKNNVTLDFGPMLQYNSELELKDDAKEDFAVSNYDNLLTQDITDISKFNANGAIGISAGLGKFLVRAQYIYGFTNILGKLNDQDLNVGTNMEKFKGNQSLITLTAMFML